MNDNHPEPFLKGTLIHLRGLERQDLNARYVSWLNDPDVNEHLFVGRRPSTMDSLIAFYDSASADPNVVIFAVLVAESGEHIGNVKLEMYDTVTRVVDWGIMIGDKAQWRRGISQEVASLTCSWAFERWNAHKITLGVSAGNEAAIRAYEKAGFKIEGRQTSQIYERGRYVDKILMGLLRKDASI
jgi:[ribosomal protein S5]-alanine N-acetyltransferase